MVTDRMRVEKQYQHMGGASNPSVIERVKQVISNEEFALNYVEEGQVEKICRMVGFSDPLIVREYGESGRKKLRVSGSYGDLGLQVWFSNQHYLFKFLISLQLLYTERKISSAILITSTKDETIDRIRRIKLSKGERPPKSTVNYCDFESSVAQLKAVEEVITIPLTVMGLQESV